MSYYLILSSIDNVKNLSFFKGHELPDIFHTSRISPIFPLMGNEAEHPNFNSSIHLLLCFSPNPFVTIGRMAEDLDNELLQNLWYSHGIASILIFSKDKTKLKIIGNNSGYSLRGYEIWDIENSEIKKKPTRKLEQYDLEMFIPPVHPALPESSLLLLQEYKVCLQRAKSYASQYFPAHTVIFQTLQKKVEKMTKRFSDILQLEGDSPDEKVYKIKNDHSFSEQMVEINSALTLLIAQAYSGSSPIFEGVSIHQRYSLFGIGNALNAIFAIYQFVYQIFERFTIDDTIKNEYNKESIRGFNVIDKTKWINKMPQLDDTLKETEEVKFDNYHLMYFSGRWGFHASLHTITAAVQCIHSAAKAEWTLMTLTHEYMHAHVRAILDTIKYSSKEKDELQKLANIYSSIHLKDTEGMTIRECLNLSFLHYCFLLSSAKKSVTQEVKSEQITFMPKEIASGEYIVKILKYYDPAINEIIAHTLDYSYFYGARHDLYIKSLWSSWAVVPKVLLELDHYIGRTLCTIASRMTGNNETRFNESIGIFENELRIMDSNHQNIPILNLVLDILSDKKKRRDLRLVFTANLYLVDVTFHFLLSSKVNSRIFKDLKSHFENDEYTYAIKELEFTAERPIESPIAFILDRLNKQSPLETSQDLEQCSLWELLALISTQNQEGD